MSLIPLNHLLNATAKATVEKCINLCFITRSEDSMETLKVYQSLLEISISEATELYEVLLSCIKVSLATGSVEALAELFTNEGAEVNQKLKQMVGSIIQNKLDLWKESATFDRVSLPKLVDLDWNLHLTKASNEASAINSQSVFMSLSAQDIPSTTNALPEVREVNFELTREALETVVDGLGKIRDQLSRMG